MGYCLERGIMPEHVLQLSRAERLFYIALAQMNEDKRIEEIVQTVEAQAKMMGGGRYS